MYDVLDICEYIIDYCNEKDYGVSNLKLQKLLYFVQAFFLISDDGLPCFHEEIEAWAFGPIVPKAYYRYRIYGFSNIQSSHKELDSVINYIDKEKIASVVEMFKNYSAPELVRLTYQQRPWIDAYAQGRNTVIGIEEIRDYFNGKQ